MTKNPSDDEVRAALRMKFVDPAVIETIVRVCAAVRDSSTPTATVALTFALMVSLKDAPPPIMADAAASAIMGVELGRERFHSLCRLCNVALHADHGPMH